jgi:hypothetical protein
MILKMNKERPAKSLKKRQLRQFRLQGVTPATDPIRTVPIGLRADANPLYPFEK